MNNKKSIAKRFHAVIRTQPVFIKDEQVFLKEETPEIHFEDSTVAEWFPTNFKWTPIQL